MNRQNFMKTILRKSNILLIAAILWVPGVSNAQFGGDSIGWDSDFGGDSIGWGSDFGGDSIGWGSDFGGDSISWDSDFGGDSIGWDSDFGGDSIGWDSDFGGDSIGWGSDFGGDSIGWGSDFGGDSISWDSDFGGDSIGWDSDFGGDSIGWDSDFGGDSIGWDPGYRDPVVVSNSNDRFCWECETGDAFVDNYRDDNRIYNDLGWHDLGGCGWSNCDNRYFRDRDVIVRERPIVIREPRIIVRDDPLDVVCRVSDTRVDEGDIVRYEVEIDGGSSPYDIDWSGSVSGNDRTESVRFNSSGTKHARVRVEDDRGRTASDTCPAVFVDNDRDRDDDNDFEISCKISDTRIDEGDRITIEVEIDGGNSPFEIKWSGDDNEIDDFDDDKRSQRVRINDRGRYDLEVRVEDDDGRVRRDDCRTIIVDDDRDRDDDVNVVSTGGFSSNTGNFASVDSVFLNQIPYTGPGDWAKGAGFVGLVLLWSAAVGYAIRKKSKKNTKSKEIEKFKELNKVGV
jgi:hypothetical protein